MTEVWKSVVGYEGLYEVSNLGRVRSVARTVRQLNKIGKPRTYSVRGRILKTRSYDSYVYIDLAKDGKLTTCMVHRLVLLAFVGPCPDGMETRHLDGNKQNNSWPKNLAWGTHAQNEQDKKQNGTYQYGEKNPRAKLTVEDVAFIRKSKETARALAKKFNVSQNNIFLIKHNHTWQEW